PRPHRSSRGYASSTSSATTRSGSDAARPPPRRRLQELGIDETEWADEADSVSTKVRDPDGYVVEISWEPDDRPVSS
ncbi:MAG: hypothetical protein ACRDY4_10320, partial [Acidimicrobiia bacterium]